MTIDDNLDGWLEKQLTLADDSTVERRQPSRQTVDGFVRRIVRLRPLEALDHRDRDWQNAIVFVIDGELTVECWKGERHSFREGDVLTLARLPIVRAANSGANSTRLLVISPSSSSRGDLAAGSNSMPLKRKQRRVL